MIREHVRFIPAQKIAYRSIGGKVAIVKPGENRFIILNEVGSLVWNQLEKGDAAYLVREVCAVFDVTVEIAGRDVGKFLAKLLAEKLIVPMSQEGGLKRCLVVAD